MRNSFKSSLNIGSTLTGMKAAPDMAGQDFQAFLTSLLTYESGIGPELISEYEEKYDLPDATTYWQMRTVNGINVPDTDNNGNLISISMSYRDYFTVLHVNDIWESADNGQHTTELVYRMQCASMNAWNFIGYQLGEAVLIDAGHYIPQKAVWTDGKTYDRYYIWTGIPWTGDEIERLYQIPDGPTIIATRINMWQGEFTGLDGINNITELRETGFMERAMRNAIWRNVDYIEAHLGNITLEQALSRQWTDPINGLSVQSTMSGIIAGAHLAGAQGATSLLVNNEFSADETGTSILTYMQKFGGASTIVDTPGNDVLTGTIIPERITCGLGTDTVKTGGSGSNRIFVETSQPDTIVTIDDLNIDTSVGANDRVFMRNTSDASFRFSDNGEGNILLAAIFPGNTTKYVILKGISLQNIQDVISQVFFISADYGFKWAADGELDTIKFRYPGDFFVPGEANGIKFENILIDKMDINNVRIRVLAGDMGSYFGFQLTGYTADDIKPDMFRGLGGRFSDMHSGFSININDFVTSELFLIPNGWNVQRDALFLSGWIQKFSNAAYRQVGDHVYYFPNGADDHYIVLLSTNWNTDVVLSSRQVIYQSEDNWDNIGLVRQK